MFVATVGAGWGVSIASDAAADTVAADAVEVVGTGDRDCVGGGGGELDAVTADCGAGGGGGGGGAGPPDDGADTGAAAAPTVVGAGCGGGMDVAEVVPKRATARANISAATLS